MQASVLDGFAFDPFSFQQNCLTASEVDVGRRQIVDALVVAQVIVVGDEGFDPLDPRATRGRYHFRLCMTAEIAGCKQA